MKKSIYSHEHLKLVEKLIEARNEAGMDQTQVAKKLKVTQSFISKIESGQTKIDIFQLLEFAKIYKKDLYYFIK
jgi:transcriptional regulator with XRE-family HTH domain